MFSQLDPVMVEPQSPSHLIAVFVFSSPMVQVAYMSVSLLTYVRMCMRSTELVRSGCLMELFSKALSDPLQSACLSR